MNKIVEYSDALRKKRMNDGLTLVFVRWQNLYLKPGKEESRRGCFVCLVVVS